MGRGCAYSYTAAYVVSCHCLIGDLLLFCDRRDVSSSPPPSPTSSEAPRIAHVGKIGYEIISVTSAHSNIAIGGVGGTDKSLAERVAQQLPVRGRRVYYAHS
jgi:hypothetical protein